MQHKTGEPSAAVADKGPHWTFPSPFALLALTAEVQGASHDPPLDAGRNCEDTRSNWENMEFTPHCLYFSTKDLRDQKSAMHLHAEWHRTVAFLFCFLRPHAWHMEVPRLGIESEL